VASSLGWLRRGRCRAELLDVAFTDCIIEEVDLVETAARRVACHGNTRVSRLNMQHAKLQHVDLRGADFEEITSLDGLRGTTINPNQLNLLAPLLAYKKGHHDPRKRKLETATRLFIAFRRQ
jgi:uncharacterized protein YjbI with pentapeptide repeats